MAAEEIDEALFPSKADMNEADNLWKQGEEENKRARPQGPFQVEIADAVLERASSSGRLQITYNLTVLNGPSKGEELIKRDGLGSPKQAGITQTQLQKLGVDTTKTTMKTLPAELLRVKGKRMNVNGKINGDFYNISFVKPVQESLTESGGGGAATATAGRKAPAKKKF